MSPRLYASSPFYRFAKWTARAAGHPTAFGLAVLAILAWMTTGPVFDFSDTWQLVVNTATTIVTFLMVFLIQNTQNRDAEAMQLKLDELIRSTQGAHNAFLDLEELTERELDRIKARYIELARTARESATHGRGDVDTPEVGSE
jgi:low affinity Fe/Cu permease